MKRLISRLAFLGAFSALLAPALAFAAAPTTFRDLSDQIVTILNSATGVLVVLGLVVYFWGVSSNLFSNSEHGRANLRSYIIWGLAIIFVMVSIWGILSLLQNSLFGGSAASPTSGVVSNGTSGCGGFGC
jgi:fumarate reductase subunit D